MHTHRQIFALSLSSEQSIGPRELRALWALACDSADVSVKRRSRNSSHPGMFSYDLYAGSDFVRDVGEPRLRLLLQAKGLNFKLIYFPG